VPCAGPAPGGPALEAHGGRGRSGRSGRPERCPGESGRPGGARPTTAGPQEAELPSVARGPRGGTQPLHRRRSSAGGCHAGLTRTPGQTRGWAPPRGRGAARRTYPLPDICSPEIRRSHGRAVDGPGAMVYALRLRRCRRSRAVASASTRPAASATTPYHSRARSADRYPSVTSSPTRVGSRASGSPYPPEPDT
jgi:hypothetical protein